jgi:Ca2+-binding RTX toxin-like protein
MSQRRTRRRCCSAAVSAPAQMSPLESRRLLAAAVPSNYEQYLVELINRGRADPAAEAARYGIDLNEGLPAGTITTAPKQPLAINPYLTDGARGHSQWMIDNDVFSHTGAGGSHPNDRMSAAGYLFTGSYTWGENIAYRSTSASLNQSSFTAQIHSDLFVDAGIAERGHRTNLMNGNFREIGAGIATGDFAGLNALMGTEDFAKTGAIVFLTGIAYVDNVTADHFYTPGEGLGGVTITAKRAGDGVVIGTTTTWSSGGYSLALPAGTYNVTASGGSLGGTATSGNVVLGDQNVKRDFTPANLDAFATIASNKLTIVGTLGVDDIGLASDGNGNFVVIRNGATQTLASAGVTSIDIFGYDGDDYVHVGPAVLGVYVDAGAGNDYIQGGDGNDTITSGAGKDRAFGGLGDDRVAGNGGHDKLFGEAGKDRLYGGEGNDTLDGGSSADRLWGENGNNTYFGQGGNDYIYARNSLADVAYGGTGTDHAQTDVGAIDTLSAVEDLLP